jgi:hypothetical protein
MKIRIKKSILSELAQSKHWMERVIERGEILDIINFPKDYPLSKQEVINIIQTELIKRFNKLENTEIINLSTNNYIAYKILKPILKFNGKSIPLQLKVKYKKNNIEKETTGISYIGLIYKNNLITLLLKNEDDDNNIIHDVEKHLSRLDKNISIKILSFSDYNFFISHNNDNEIKLIDPKDLKYILRTDYRKGAKFNHEEYGEVEIINTSSGVKGTGDSNGKLDWIEFKVKPYLKNGKLLTTRRIENIYTKVSPLIKS